MLTKLNTTPREIKNILKTLPLNKAPGEDEVATILLKNLPKKVIVQLIYVINAVLLLQHFPKQWKGAIVVPILKPGKSPVEPGSYRPIALLNAMSKVVEKVILNRIKTLDLDKGIPKEQFGFKEDHSTVLLAANVVQNALNKIDMQQSTVLLALDIENTFDKVWFNGLIY